MKRHLLIFLLAALPAAAFAEAPDSTAVAPGRPVMIQKSNFAAGAQFAYMKLDSDNSELLQIIGPIGAKGSISHITPFFEYAYRDDCSLGAKLQFLVGDAAIDNLSIDLLSEGLNFNVTDIDSHLKRFSAFIYHRNYFALDRRSRVGVIAEESLCYSHTVTDYDHDAPGTKYSKGDKITLAVSPGIIFFVMNNISVSFTLSMASISYNSVKSYRNSEVTGGRDKFGARFGVDITGINFEIGFHF